MPMVFSAWRRTSTSSRLLAELQRTRAPGDRALGVLAVHAQGRNVRVGQAELASGPERLEDGHGLLAEALRLLGPRTRIRARTLSVDVERATKASSPL